MKRYLNFLLKNKFSIILLSLMIIGIGWFYTRNMPESIFPDVNFPRISVLVHSGRLPVKFMLVQATKPLEAAAEGEPGVRLVRSQTGNGISKITVYFESNIKPHIAYLMLESRLSQVALPPGSKMTVRLMSPNVYPFAEYALVSNRQGYNSSDMMSVFAFKIRPALLSVKGIYQIEGTGRGWPEVGINLNPLRLAQYHISPESIVKILQSYQGPFFSGVLDAYHKQFVVATTPRPADIKDLSNLMIPVKHTLLPLKTLGAINISPPPLIREAAVSGYRHTLIIDIMPDLNINTVKVAGNIGRRIKFLNSHLPKGLKIVPVYNTSRLIHSNLKDVWIALILGGLIALFVVFLFLKRMDGALIALAVIPVSVSLTVVILNVLGFGLNIMTLGGLTASIGAMIDHAIVIVERGFHKMKGETGGKTDADESALERVGKILPLMTAATITSSIVFIPLIFIHGTLGILFKQMALSIVIALITSQLTALTLTPILTVILAKRKSGGTFGKIYKKNRLRKIYGYILIKGMRSPWLALPVIFTLIITIALSLFYLRTAFLPKWDEGIFVVPFRTPVASSVARTERTGKYLLRIAKENPNVKIVSLVVGRSLDNPYSTPNKGDLTIVLRRNRTETTEKIMRKLYNKFYNAAPNLISLNFQQLMVNRLGFLSGSHAPLEVMLFGKSSNALRKYGKILAGKLRKTGDFQYVNFKSPSAGPEITLTPSDYAAAYGISPPVIADKVKRLLWGQKAGFLLYGEQVLPVRVFLEKKSASLPELKNWPFTLKNGTHTRLDYISKIRVKKAVPFITHQNMAPYAYIFIQPVKGEGLSAGAAKARSIIGSMHLPPSVTASIGGYYRSQVKSFRQMAVMLAFALILIFVFFGFQFASQRAAIASMIAIALSGAGALAALLITGIELDSTAFLGILLVFAISTNNAILIFARSRQISGAVNSSPSPSSVFLAARERLRPILMTMLADVFGFLPLAIGIGRGTDLLKPLSVAVMGGLLISVFMSLWLAPVIYGGLFMKKKYAKL
ncbi:MAG: efflux RND transporter permease subunit [Deltaproteobacteria bacterium]|nr:efflux RND transporter permease subunit [Deltaproteobacteria bacterium]